MEELFDILLKELNYNIEHELYIFTFNRNFIFN